MRIFVERHLQKTYLEPATSHLLPRSIVGFLYLLASIVARTSQYLCSKMFDRG